MNLSLEAQGQAPSRVLQEKPQILQVALNFLKLIQPDTTPGLDFSQAFELCEFQLGDDLVNYRVSPLSGDTVHCEQNSWDFYLVCHGTVRLLGFNANRHLRKMVIPLAD